MAAWPGSANADAPDATAYWMRTNPNSALPAAAPNPAVPSGGLYVQSDRSTEATTPTAYSAVRFNIPEGATGTLTLKLTPSSA